MLSSVFTWVKVDSTSACVNSLPSHLPAPRKVKEVVCSTEFEGLATGAWTSQASCSDANRLCQKTGSHSCLLFLGVGPTVRCGSPEHGAQVPSRSSHPFNSTEMPECQTGSHHRFLCLQELSPLFTLFHFSFSEEHSTRLPQLCSLQHFSHCVGFNLN